MKILIRPRQAATTAPSRRIDVRPSTIRITQRPLRILDLDCEARPLHWISNEYVSKEITAIAWAWIGEPSAPTCYVLGPDEWGGCGGVEMLTAFCAAYAQADMVTGHFIRGYDLATINGALSEYQLPPLGKKYAQDTKIDLMRRSGLSGSQENIAAMLGLVHPKIKMDQTKWREANRLTKDGLLFTRERVIGDVVQHMEMRQKLLELGYLGPARLWESNSAEPLAAYTP